MTMYDDRDATDVAERALKGDLWLWARLHETT